MAGRSTRWRDTLPPVGSGLTKQHYSDTPTLRAVLCSGNSATINLVHYNDGKLFVEKQFKKDRGEMAKKRFEAEVYCLRRLIHPNIVKLHLPPLEGRENRQPLSSWSIALEYMDKGSLRDVIDRVNTVRSQISTELIENFAKAVAVQSLLGLQLLHVKNTLHRDVKPENLLVNTEGRIKWCDFETSTDAPEPSTVNGTELYQAPEILMPKDYHNRNYTAKVDVWGLGLTLYRVIVGKLPNDFCGLQPARLLCSYAADKIQSAVDQLLPLPETVSPSFVQLLRQMLVVNPDDRADTFSLLLQESLRKHYPIQTRATDTGNRLAEKAKALQDLNPGISFLDPAECKKELEFICQLPENNEATGQFLAFDKYKQIVAARQWKAIDEVKGFLRTLDQLIDAQSKVSTTYIIDHAS